MLPHYPLTWGLAGVREGHHDQNLGDITIRDMRFPRFGRLVWLVGPVGIEPTTSGLKARCSAN